MDFEGRISSAQGVKDASYNTYQNYENQANTAKTDWDTAMDSRQNYGDIYSSARDQYMNTDEINAARGVYQNARGAVDQLNTTINKLPESIRQQFGGTGMTEAQRQRALQDQYSANSNTYNMLNTNYQNASADYNDLANRAMQEVQNVAGGNYQSQQDRIGALQDAWNSLLGRASSAYGQYQGDISSLQGIYGEKTQYQMAQEQMALDRWKEEQTNARAAADRDNKIAVARLTQPINNTTYYGGTPTNTGNGKPTPSKQTSAWDGVGSLISQGFQNVANYGPLALFGGGSLWGNNKSGGSGGW